MNKKLKTHYSKSPIRVFWWTQRKGGVKQRDIFAKEDNGKKFHLQFVNALGTKRLQKFEEKKVENASQCGAKLLLPVFDEKRENEPNIQQIIL